MNPAVSAAPETLDSLDESPGETRSPPSIVPLVLGGLAWLVVTMLALLLAWLLAKRGTMVDLPAMRLSALALRAGKPIYDAVSSFVYPPTAPLFFLPLSLGSLHTSVVLYAYLQVAMVLLTLIVVMRYTLRRSPWTLLVSAVIAAAFIAGDVGYGIFRDGNASLLLLVPLALVIICFGSGRWNLGALILVVTLLIKPLLLPVVLVPILARRWTATALTFGLTTIGVVLGTALFGDVSAELDAIRRLSRGSNLTREEAYNTSLQGLGLWRHLPSGLVFTARIAVALVAIACIVAVWRARPEMTLAVVGPLTGLLLAATFLAGPLSERTYLPLLMPPAFTCLLVRRNIVTGLVIAAGLLAAYNSKLAFHFGYNSSAWQLRWVGIEVLVFAACALALLAALRGEVDIGTRRTARLSGRRVRRAPV